MSVVVVCDEESGPYQNLSTFWILTMETEDDVETAARFVFLDCISQRVLAQLGYFCLP
jgi:hypothetical protein